MYRSSAIAITITGVIMIRISTDIAHHCGPRVAFWAATWSGIVWALALVGTRAIRNSFQAKMRQKMAVATIPVAAESLNAAMAATVALYECNRRMAAP